MDSDSTELQDELTNNFTKHCKSLPNFTIVNGPIYQECLKATWVVHNYSSEMNQPQISLPAFILHIPRFIKKLSCGDSHWIALTSTDRLIVSGYNSYGQLGIGNPGIHCLHEYLDINSNIIDALKILLNVTSWKILELCSGARWSHVLVHCTDGNNHDSNILLGWGYNAFGSSLNI